MKKSRLQRHTRINPGTKGLMRTGFKSKPQDLNGTPRGSGPFRSCGSVGDASPDGRTTQPNGPTKKRLESAAIPEQIRLAVYARDEWRCMRCGIYIPDSGRRWGLQHRRPRQAGGSRLLHTMPNLVLLCGWTVDAGTCTAWVELGDRERAAAEGWLLPHKLRQIMPEEWPVLRWTRTGREWQQPGDTWRAATPHPRQLEMGAAA